LTPDRLLLPIAPWILAVRACRDASLKEDEPTIELAAEEDPAVALADVPPAGLLAGAAVLLLGEEQAASAASAPALTARPAAIFLFIKSPCAGSTKVVIR
jgi:hypothetical protein